eukprot:3125406-Amphidinium_carterae.1
MAAKCLEHGLAIAANRKRVAAFQEPGQSLLECAQRVKAQLHRSATTFTRVCQVWGNDVTLGVLNAAARRSHTAAGLAAKAETAHARLAHSVWQLVPSTVIERQFAGCAAADANIG